MPTLIQYLKSEFVLAPVAEKLGIGEKNLKNRINISLGGNKPYISRGLLKVTVRGKNKIQNLIIMENLSKDILRQPVNKEN